MSGSTFGKFAAVSAGMVLMSGCLVSEVALLDERTGRARPLKNSDYIACPISDDADPDDCDKLTVSYQNDRSFRFSKEGEDDDAIMRFRKVGRKGYAMQSNEGDDAFAYYYAAGDSERLTLTMMMCSELPEATRDRMIRRGDLEPDGEDYESCELKTIRGLTEVAKAYHRDQIESDVPIVIELTRVSQE